MGQQQKKKELNRGNSSFFNRLSQRVAESANSVVGTITDISPGWRNRWNFAGEVREAAVSGHDRIRYHETLRALTDFALGNVAFNEMEIQHVRTVLRQAVVSNEQAI